MKRKSDKILEEIGRSSLLSIDKETALCKAVQEKGTDASRGFKFISYAVWWIRQSILVAIESKK